MKVQHTVSFLLARPEYHLIGRLLDQQPSWKLSPALKKLQAGIADALDAGVVDLAVDFPLDALHAIAALLMAQDRLSLENRGIDAEFAYGIAKAFADNFGYSLRTGAGPLTPGEKDDVGELLRSYRYDPPVEVFAPSFESLVRHLFGDDAIIGDGGLGLDVSGIGPDDTFIGDAGQPDQAPPSDPSLN